MYDFVNAATTICDIDFFRKTPTYNDIGEEYWGTKRLKAPEEYTYGATIDGATNVFTLGALIFYFFGSYSDGDIRQIYKDNAFFPCPLEKWELCKDAYEVTLKAINKDRSGRYQTMSDFFRAWQTVLSKNK